MKLKVVLICISCLGLTLAILWYNILPNKNDQWLPQISKFSPPQEESISTYQGQPPWETQRPDESFPFPIKPGEIGPIKPRFATKPSYPFYCRSLESGLGQPLVDNHEGFGIPVYENDFSRDTIKSRGAIIGYSKDCSVPTKVHYYYNRRGSGKFFPLAQTNNDIEKIMINGRQEDFIVRVETGTINRFLYSIMSLKGHEGTPENIDASLWNKRLIYFFQGGVGVGRQQGRLKYLKTLKHAKEQLAQGYAILYSTGNQTSVHYDIALSEDTALRVKKQFTSQFGKPLYTVGVGGSGGAIQQYLLAQNNPGAIIDAAIPLYSYPDMVTQTIYSFDCELLEHYFDVTDKENERWQIWENRSLVEGMNASSEKKRRFSKLEAIRQISRLKWPTGEKGASECTNGWRGLTPLVHNPRLLRHRQFYSKDVIGKVHWTYWEDLKTTFGKDEHGYARTPWDNVGVQYGLEALKKDQLSIQEFLKLNENIGGWKKPHQMHRDNFWIYTGNTDPRKIDIYSSRNMTKTIQKSNSPASRTSGDIQAIRAAYRSGNVFLGALDIPILEVRHYLEKDLDMHHLSSSFSTRERILQTMQQADHHILWVSPKAHKPVKEAFELMDKWMLNIIANNNKDVALNKPDNAIDSCFDKNGKLLASGENVWDGQWNNKANGQCTDIYPPYTNSRIVSGASWSGYTFKCSLQSVDKALANGTYGDINMQPFKKKLEHIFPQGVCDYTKPGIGSEFIGEFVHNYRRDQTKAKRFATLGGIKAL